MLTLLVVYERLRVKSHWDRAKSKGDCFFESCRIKPVGKNLNFGWVGRWCIRFNGVWKNLIFGCSNMHPCNGSFPLPDSDSDSDSDSKPYGYIVLCRTCFHWLRFKFESLSHSICIVKESVSKSESESESGNGNKPWQEICIPIKLFLEPFTVL